MLEARAGLRPCFILRTFGPPCLSTNVKPDLKRVKNTPKERHNLTRSLFRKMSDALTEREENDAEHKAHFTPRAIQAFELAEQEATRLNSDVIDTEHVLLGLLKLGRGVAANVLTRMEVDLEQARVKMEEGLAGGREMKIHHPVPLTRSVKRVLVRAEHEARSLFHAYVGTEHILLGLISEHGGAAAQVLKAFGVRSMEARRQVLKELEPNEH